MKRRSSIVQSANSFILGLLIFLLSVEKCYPFKTLEVLTLKQDKESDTVKTENKVWAVLPISGHELTQMKHTTDAVPVTRKRRSKFPRDSGRFRQFNRRVFPPRTGAASENSYSLSASGSGYPRNGMIFSPRNINSPVYCPSGCVCFYNEVECKYANWRQIPYGFPMQTEKL
ncbi:hypothetical protein FBUS_00545 [Fasciolopsis buskii]|uniref:Uncharacterized protein n=1 Tax=Fasciolopsis buskii TaxID=27845 RepID=A0A8E0VCG1_9TREM|nr:hypothetical protein FBUS_00545 [Fasciolopsis buski]